MNDEECQTVGLDVALGRVPSVPRPLLANTLWAIGGSGFYHACQLGVLVLLAKFASPEIQGQYFLALAIATPVVLFFGLELRGALVADAGNQFTFGAYWVLRGLTMLPATVVLLGFLVWQAVFWEAHASYLIILGGVFAGKIVWSLAEVGWGTFQRRERLDLLAASVGLRGLALILPFAAFLPLYGWLADSERISPSRLADGTALAVSLHALGVTLALFLFDRPRVLDPRCWDLSVTTRQLRALALQTFPLGVVALIVNLCDTLPRILIESQPEGKACLGYFGALAYITMAGNLVIIQAGTAAANRLSLYYQRDLRAFLRLGVLLAALAVALGAAVMFVALVFGRWILTLLYTTEYAQFETEFHIIVFAHCLALLTNIFGTATTQMRLFWVQVPVQAITLVCTVAAALLLIPGPTPVLGAALTALVRALVQLVLYAACVGLGLAARGRILQRW